MVHYEYMTTALRLFPQDIIDQYKIMHLLDKHSLIYDEIRNGMYSLKKTARIYFDRLLKVLKPHGYYPL